MAAMAAAALAGGAAAIRANGGADIAAIRAICTRPLIGLIKRWSDETPVYITPDFAAAREAAMAGADIIALDATARPRGKSAPSPAVLIGRIKQELGRQVLADIATCDEGEGAARAGADYVATTLAGYTGASAPMEGPDLTLVAALAERLSVPVIAEGRFHTPDQVALAFAAGAHAVVVGTAITNPREITRRFATACPAGGEPASP